MSEAIARAGIFALATIAGLGCSAFPMPFKTLPIPFRSPTAVFTEAELREELVIFASRFASAVNSAGDEIRAESQEPQLYRKTLLWKMRMIPIIQEAASAPDPQEAYVAMLYATALQRRFFTEGDGKEIFGVHTPVAVRAAESLEDECFSIAENFLTTEQLERLRSEVAEFIATRSISGSDFSVPALRRTALEAKKAGRFTWLMDLPMSPFRALEGVGSGAAAIHDFNDTALRFSLIAEGLPEQLRWQAELLLYEIESRESVEAVLHTLETFAENARRLTESVERLPEDLTRILSEAQDPLLEANRALLTIRELMQPLSETVSEVSLAGESWARLVRGDGHDGDADSSKPGRPFDIREYKATAQSIRDAATELHGLVAEAGSVIGSPGLEAALAKVDSSAALAEDAGRGVVDHAAWRGLQLLLVFFGLLFVYRLVTSRLPRASSQMK